jgi:predicted enzyme related to lactoylglutathione lyase
MSESETPPVGSIGWCDLTVENADTIRDFYRGVVGWTSTDVDMGG